MAKLDDRVVAIEQQLSELLPLALRSEPGGSVPVAVGLLPALGAAATLAATAYAAWATPEDVARYAAAVEAADVSDALRRRLLAHVAPFATAAIHRRQAVQNGVIAQAERAVQAGIDQLAALHVDNERHAARLARDGVTMHDVDQHICRVLEEHVTDGRPALSWLIEAHGGVAHNWVPRDEQPRQVALFTMLRAAGGAGRDHLGSSKIVSAFAALAGVDHREAEQLLALSQHDPRGAPTRRIGLSYELNTDGR